MAERPYSRVYHSIVDDAKFSAVFDSDHLLATWLRLLLVADASYPSSAYIPAGTNRKSLAALVEVGLIDLGPGSRYRIHGLASEREMRSESARNAAAVRWHSNGTADRNAIPMLDETRRDKPRRDEQTRARSTVDNDPVLRAIRDAQRASYGEGMDYVGPPKEKP